MATGFSFGVMKMFWKWIEIVVVQHWFCFLFFLVFFLMAVLGLRFCTRAFSSCGEQGPLLIMVRGPLTIVASLVAEHRLQTHRLSSCGTRAQLLHSTWDPPRPGLEPVSPALAGRFSTTAPPGKTQNIVNVLIVTELFTLKRLILWYVNFTSILKMKDKFKTFLEKEKLKEFVTNRPALQEILILQAKMKGHRQWLWSTWRNKEHQ